MSKPKICEILEGHRQEQHVVVLHTYPDSDAIAAAYAHHLISTEFEIETTIVYGGKISHQQNVALVRLLGIDLVPYTPDLDLSQYQAAVFVDNQGANADAIPDALQAANVPVLIVVDHHERQDLLKAEYSDVQHVGATSTLYAGYLEQGAVTMDTARKEHVAAATALMHGILADTGGFVRANSQDFQAAAFLSRFRDAELLEQIMSQARSKQSMEIIQRALGNRIIVESFSIAGIGYLRANDRDTIPQAADFMLTEENVHTALVYGIVREDTDEENLVGSLRTAKFTLDPDSFIKEVFGKRDTDRYYGGGKPGAGGFNIPLDFLAGNHNEKFQDLKWQLYDAQIKYKVFAKIGVEPQTVEI